MIIKKKGTDRRQLALHVDSMTQDGDKNTIYINIYILQFSNSNKVLRYVKFRRIGKFAGNRDCIFNCVRVFIIVTFSAMSDRDSPNLGNIWMLPNFDLYAQIYFGNGDALFCLPVTWRILSRN